VVYLIGKAPEDERRAVVRPTLHPEAPLLRWGHGGYAVGGCDV